MFQHFAQAICLCLLMVFDVERQVFAQQVADARQERLAAALTSGSEEQRLEAAIELGSLLSASKATSQTVSALRGVLQTDSSAVMKALAVRAMEFSADDRFVTILLASLNSEKDIAISKAVIYALARHRSSEVLAVLLARLKDKKQDIRAAAAFALAEFADPASTAALIEVLKKRGKDEDVFARSQAARGLGKIGDRTAIEALLAALQKDKSAEVRRECVRALGLVATGQDAKVIEALKQAMLQADPYLVNLASFSMEKLKL
ncbi:MAG: HEAT repeat domain-containing protein [Blastocatellia bacterium]